MTSAEEHPSKEVIEKMCSESYFTHHKYLYVESNQRHVPGLGAVDEDQYEFRETPNISQSLHQGSSVPYQLTRESLLTVGLSRDRSSKFGQGQQAVEQEGEPIESRDYYYSYAAVDEMFGEQRGCSISQPEDAFSDHDQNELCESPGGSCNYKFGQGKQTVEQVGESIESRDYYYSYPAVDEMFGEERACSISQPEDAFSHHEQYELCESPGGSCNYKFGQGQQAIEQESEPIESSDYYYSNPAVDEMFGEERGCSMSQPEDAFSDYDQYELCESPGDGCNYKFGQGKQTVEIEGELVESIDHYYPVVEEMFGDEGGFSLSPVEGEVSAHPQAKIVQTSYHGDEKEHDNRVVFLSFQPQEFCHSPKTEEMYASRGANGISENEEVGVEVEHGHRHEPCLENNTVYRDLDKTTEGYMPLSIEQRTEEKPCFITSDTKELSTSLPQNIGNDSSAECYSCVDILVQGPHQGQEDERFSSEPINSAEISQNMEYIMKCDSNEDMAIQKLLKAAECLYQDIVQGREKVSA